VRPTQPGTTATPLTLDNHAIQRIGLLTISFGIVLAVAGIAVALRSASLSATVAPVVTASLVIARALAGLALVGFGVALMRLGERLLLSKPDKLQGLPGSEHNAPPTPPSPSP